MAHHNGRLRVLTEDQLTHAQVELETDTVVLASAIVPNPGNKELAQLLKVPLGEEGFFLEAHRKLRPIDFATDGIFLCGAAHSPMGLREAVAQAAGADFLLGPDADYSVRNVISVLQAAPAVARSCAAPVATPTSDRRLTSAWTPTPASPATSRRRANPGQQPQWAASPAMACRKGRRERAVLTTPRPV